MHNLLLIIPISIVGFMVAGMWKTFAKAGLPGWWALLPVFNAYGLIRISGDPGWALVMLFIPLVNLFFLVHLYLNVAKAFGKGVGYGLGLIFLPFIFFPLIGFGEAQFCIAAT